MAFNTANAYSLVLQALCVWRESRNQAPQAQRGVLWTILNRAGSPMWWNGNKAFDTTAVIMFPEQYSSFNKGDPNATKFPTSTDLIFQNILTMTIAPGEDPTDHATSYYSVDIPAPYWVPSKVFCCQIDAMRFYKEATAYGSP